ncbi:MAG TPA: ATP-binding protein [Terriglobales bacterium]|jgi:hypothetical protein|nr:ATP-binding protein [Terriglobales bacterium]
MKVVTVQVKSDHLQTIANVSRPISAVSELIWNGLDADAKEVKVVLLRNQIDGLTSLTVEDNGHGLPYQFAEDAFQNLGGSWKRNETHTPGGRLLHGQHGRGRFKAFGIGSQVTWNSRYEEDGIILEYSISGSSNKLGSFEISDPAKSSNATRGMTVEVFVNKNYTSLMGDKARDEIAEEFALYLLQYPNASIFYDGKKIDVSALIRNVSNYLLAVLKQQGGQTSSAELSIVEWNRPTERALFLCDESGVALHRINAGIQAPGFEFTAYLKSSYIRELDATGNLHLEEIDPILNGLLESSRDQLRSHFRQRATEVTAEVVAEWKKEKIYPYSGEPASVIEKAAREVFDVVAVNVNSYLPDFDRADSKNKKFSLQLLKQALERDPGELEIILNDVLALPPDRKKDLAELLKKTTLSSVISASKIVADRLNFIRGLEEMIFEKDNKEALLERKELHRILANETWIFGEQFHMAVDDESLDQVLNKHLKLLGRARQDNSPVVDEHGKVRIVDLMLSKRIPLPKPEQRQHLIVELKRPTQRINGKVQNQIIDYAIAVSSDERFRDTQTEWHFWAISNEMDESVRAQANQKNRPAGLLHDGTENVYVWAKTWGQIIQECKGRLEFFGEQLQYQADRQSALEYLHKTHEKYLPKTMKMSVS